MSANPRGQTRNKANHDQSDELKRRARRRLVGSIVLFLTAVIVVPAVIESEPAEKSSPIELVVPERPSLQAPLAVPEKTAEASSNLPATEHSLTAIPQAETAKPSRVEAPKEKPVSVAKVEPKPATPKPQPKQADTQPAKTTIKTEPAKSEPTRAESVKPPEIVKSAPASSPISADPIEKFAQADVYWVQVAALKDEVRAQGLRDKLREAGFEGRIESVSTDAGKVYRVRVGPLAGQPKANDVQARLKKLGYNGRVVQ